MFDVEYQIAKSADNLEIVVCVLLVFKCAWFNVNVQCDQLENILKEYTYIIAYVTKLFGTLCDNHKYGLWVVRRYICKRDTGVGN